MSPPVWMGLIYAPTLVGILAARSTYRSHLNRNFLGEFASIEAGVALSAMILLALTELTGALEDPGTTVVKIWLCAALLMPAGRAVRVTTQAGRRQQSRLTSPTLIVGNGLIAHQIIDRLKYAPEYGLTPVGLVSFGSPWRGSNNDVVTPHVRHLGTPDEIEQIIQRTGAECVVVAFSNSPDESLTRAIRVAHSHGLRVWVVPRMFDLVGERARVEHIGGLPLLALRHANPKGWQFTIKHISDRILAGFGLVVISPLFLTLMLLVRRSSPGPIFFGQPRVGRDGRVFDCLKFRSMRAPRDSDAAFELDPDSAPGGVEGEDRRTGIGKIMRSTSMDELPQLINVLKGEMSLVGPRPERPEFVELFESQIRRYGDRHRVRAGVTGWAQVHGLRGQTSIADRAEWDNYYIENWSLALDLKILLLTIPAVLRRAE
ncbi:undecaprenyl-phosphate glucose phosphotransferase [Mycolicibacterium cyprinidarum]|uniref:Undecaprenyl-phosphate glucose phosphotransferase n=1 Tax=Mycolicibacterium cyprinidarum TaxID=2860311 RepID=A0ABQ4VB42_9MYCO|nr:undecaprenyl-phosphate glucose phosphotransferase [Mycolicibacterium sp. NGTWS0302]GJF10884.1 undecaprenyl-phosphate glucose phosphotransferase [Mycolicibacterium sp. NGTWSNA01]GJF18169.1 undecaprenyl-phosphate glucose phosphotransferase [Mycolicibacterium sp. NGTWS1803]